MSLVAATISRLCLEKRPDKYTRVQLTRGNEKSLEAYVRSMAPRSSPAATLPIRDILTTVCGLQPLWDATKFKLE